MKKIYAISKEMLATLPQEVQERVRQVLKAYDQVNIVYEYGKYNVSTMIGITATYAEDHKYIGNVYADDIYTEDERMINYIESFHDYPIQYKGRRDYRMLNEVGYNWDAKFKFDENHNLVRA